MSRYTIGQVSSMTGLSIATLRFYDKVGLFPHLQREESGTRRFTDDDLNQIRLIECLKKTGMELVDIRSFIRWVEQGDSTIQKRRELFESRKAAVAKEIEDLQEAMKLIDFKCWYYGRAVEDGTEQAVKSMTPDQMPEDIRELYLATHIVSEK